MIITMIITIITIIMMNATATTITNIMMKIAVATKKMRNKSIIMGITSEMKKSMSVAVALAVLMLTRKKRKNIITDITMSIIMIITWNTAAAITKMRSMSIMMSHAQADTIMSIIMESIAVAVMIMMPMKFLTVSE